MNAVQIFVEGSGDVLFLMRLLMRLEPRLIGRWKKCPDGGSLDEGAFQSPILTMRAEWNNRLLILRAANGVDNIFPMPESALQTVCYGVGVENLTVVKNVFVVDADDSVRKNGTGGIASALAKIKDEQAKCAKMHIACAGFAMPDNMSDGTLESLLAGMVPAANRKVIDCCWHNFEACVAVNGAKFSPPIKSMIDVYAKLFNKDAHDGMFASSSFKDASVWDWTAPILDPLKQFLQQEVLS